MAIIPAETVAGVVLDLFAGERSGACMVVQPGREPLEFAFRGVPGPALIPVVLVLTCRTRIGSHGPITQGRVCHGEDASSGDAAPSYAACLLAVPAAAPAATNTFLQSDALTGESLQIDHAGEVEVADWSWGASRVGGRVTVDELSLSKSVDTSSTQLFSYLTSGAAIPSAKLLVVKSTGSQRPEVYYRLCMTGVRVTSLATRGGEDGSIGEDVTLSFSTIVESYRRQNSDGSLAPAVFAGWDLINKLQYGDQTC